MRIVETEDVLGGTPRLEGRRISVSQIAELVVAFGAEPEDVADQLDVPLADVYRSLAYYYDHVDEMELLRERREDFLDELEETSKAPDTIQQ